MATLSAFGPIADAAWQHLGGINESVRRALERGPDYEPVSSFQVSYSTGAGLYVAARHWIGEDHGVKDLITWSTGPNISFRVHSGAGPDLVDNPHWNHIKNIDPRLRGEHGYELRPSGWYYPEHHFDVVAPSTMLDSELRRQIQLSAQAFLERVKKTE